MAQAIRYSVQPFSAAALAEALSNGWVDAAATCRRQHYHYFAEYLSPEHDGLGAQTILVEEPYVSQSFLADYADYYARGFTTYERLCKRIHFFRAAFDQPALEAALTDPATEAELWESYLGYVVVKPLPGRPIGATLLRPYAPAHDKRRAYPVCRPYEVNVLGKQLTLDSLIFQEQDNNVSACATTALWMAFHKTAALFQTALPSPYHITATTRNLFYRHGRTFPSAGLDQTQIGEAIEAVGLVAELRTYPQSGGCCRPAIRPPPACSSSCAGPRASSTPTCAWACRCCCFCCSTKTPTWAITITGYRLAPATALPTPDISLSSDALDRLYAHDDQMGLFEQIFTDTIRERADIVWDIYLDYSNKYKEELRYLRPVSGEPLRRILVSSLPKYIWVARATLQQTPILELVFDATDLHTGFYCLMANIFEPLRESMTDWLGQPAFRRELLKAPKFDKRFLPLLLENLGLF